MPLTYTPGLIRDLQVIKGAFFYRYGKIHYPCVLYIGINMFSKQEKNLNLNKMKELIKNGDQALFDYCYKKQVEKEPNFLKDYYNADLNDVNALNQLHEKYKFRDYVNCDLNVESQIKEMIKNAFETNGTLEDKKNSMSSVAISLERLLMTNIFFEYMENNVDSNSKASAYKDSFFPPQIKSDKSGIEKTNFCGCTIL